MTHHHSTSFSEVLADDIRRVLLRSPAKTCALDPLQTYVLLEVVEVLPFIYVMCNTSLREDSFPRTQKTAIIMPALKKQIADPDEPKSYRLISNLTFILKVLERIVMDQVTQHLEEADLMTEFHSVYCNHHYIESALMKGFSDILDAADSRQVTLLAFLDLSAAFDTVDHEILLLRLATSFGVGGFVLAWLKSSLSAR